MPPRPGTALERPFFRLWATQWLSSRGYIPRPRDTQHVHAVGPNALRILLIGNSFAVGYGVHTQAIALPGPLAAGLAIGTARGVDIDVIGDPNMTASNCVGRLAQIDLTRYDSVLLTLGVSEALSLRAREGWRDDVRAVIRHLDERNATAFVIGIPTSESSRKHTNAMQRYVQQEVAFLNEIFAEECAGSPGLVFVPLEPIAGRRFAQLPTRKTYEAWAAQMLPSMIPILKHSKRLRTRQDEHQRQLALDDLGILDTGEELRFDQYTQTARSLFGTSAAAVTFLDRDRQWTKSAVGVERGNIPREDAFCNVTIRADNLFVVEDASIDERFRENPAVAGSAHIRFYAGYPLETEDGHRIGAFCVLDNKPREFTEQDAALLRDLALRVQNEVWSGPASSTR